jgi:hypothetical protein
MIVEAELLSWSYLRVIQFPFRRTPLFFSLLFQEVSWSLCVVMESAKNVDTVVAWRKQRICCKIKVKVRGGTIWQSGGAFHGSQRMATMKHLIVWRSQTWVCFVTRKFSGPIKMGRFSRWSFTVDVKLFCSFSILLLLVMIPWKPLRY